MSYFHSVPGRLRVRVTQMRGCPELAELVRTELLSISGVRSVAVNTLLGSVLIIYDHRTLSLNDIWSELVRLECVPDNKPPMPSVAGADLDRAISSWGGRATDVLTEAAIQKIAEFSVAVLVRALI